MCARLEPYHQVKLYAAHLSPIAETNNVTVSRAGDDFMDFFELNLICMIGFVL